MTRVGLVWAQARGGAIGRDGQMPWHVPEDLAHFKRVTHGSPVVMGRHTWESLPERFRPLPGRANIVVTRDPARIPDLTAAGAMTAPSLEDALEQARQLRTAGTETVWVIGGGQLYRSALPLADELVVTRLDLDIPDADTFAPEIGKEWACAESGETLRSVSGVDLRFERYLRR